MMIRTAALCAAFALTSVFLPAVAAPAPAGQPVPAGLRPWIVDLKTSSLSFAGKQAGRSFDGKFQKFKPTIVFDPSNLGASSVTVDIDMSSAKTGDGQKDAALPTSDWFNVKAFPMARFVSTKIVAKKANTYELQGNLTIRGVTAPVTIPFTFTRTGAYATARGSTTVLRDKYGVGGGEFATEEWIAFKVDVSFVINAEKPK